MQVLRVPAEQLTNAYTKNDILSAQRDLDRNMGWYKQGKATERGTLKMHIDYVKLWDSTFPVHYYQAELEAYMAYNIVQKKREHENIAANSKRQDDSIRVAALMKDFAWINKEFVWVKQKPDAKERINR